MHVCVLSVGQFRDSERARMPVLCQRSNGIESTHILSVLTIEGVRRLLTASRSPLATQVLIWAGEVVQSVCGAAVALAHGWEHLPTDTRIITSTKLVQDKNGVEVMDLAHQDDATPTSTRESSTESSPIASPQLKAKNSTEQLMTVIPMPGDTVNNSAQVTPIEPSFSPSVVQGTVPGTAVSSRAGSVWSTPSITASSLTSSAFSSTSTSTSTSASTTSMPIGTLTSTSTAQKREYSQMENSSNTHTT